MYQDARRIRSEGHQKFPGEKNSSARHRSASEQLASKYGTTNARIFGILNEIQGFLVHDLRDLPGRINGDRPWAFQIEDLMDNEKGFDDAKKKEWPEKKPVPWWYFLLPPLA
jgi:hypothetical protein